MTSSELFYEVSYSIKSLIDFRLVGPFLTYCPENCFVITNHQNEVCGYVLTAPDASTFFDNIANRWVPLMMQKYPLHDKNVDLTPIEVSRTFLPMIYSQML
jgi:hypothetical protein